MTYDELVEKVAMICQTSPIDESWEQVAVKIIDTIREALMEPKTLSIMRKSALVAQGLAHNDGLDYRLLMEEAIKSAIAASPLAEKEK